MLISIPYLGKSAFLFYLLLHRLERQLPTAIQLGLNGYFIFNEDGPAFHPLDVEDSKLEECWALVDSNEHVFHPCEVLGNRALRVIQASSPRPERWKEWIKQKEGLYIISDLPTVPEIAAIV